MHIIRLTYSIYDCMVVHVQLKTKDGIEWLLANSVLCLNDLLDDVIPLVSVASPTSSSNAELIIGRLEL